EEIPPEQMYEFGKLRSNHLAEDETVFADELELPDSVIRAVYFIREGIRIGAACYKLDQVSGECLISDFWVFPPFRSEGAGHFCFEALEANCHAAGASVFAVYSDKPAVIRFWKAFGFTDDKAADGDLTRLRLS
ncbi:MAG: GNAT family N-acetyltransferase, partial [Clostridia bacterium]|nr:GNAT family N-acetyltransferase [Clostridia bacterium]